MERRGLRRRAHSRRGSGASRSRPFRRRSALRPGRHPLPDVAKLAETLGRWGIDSNVQVVAYDQGNGAYGARAWWLLRWLGHENVAVLDGGFAAWQEAGLPVSREPASRKPCTFTPRLEDGAFETAAQVQQALATKSIALVDARGADPSPARTRPSTRSPAIARRHEPPASRRISTPRAASCQRRNTVANGARSSARVRRRKSSLCAAQP